MGIEKFRRKASGTLLEGRDGVFAYGMPLFPAVDLRFKGNVFHVDSGHANASNNNEGSDPNRPMATIDAAIGKCTASNGDVILVSEGHAETITTADAINLDIAGISIVGLGQGALRPTITFGTNNAASIGVNAANCRIENMLFLCNKDGVTAMLDVDSTDLTLVNCEFREGSAEQWATAVDINGGAVNACDRTKIYGCRFKSLAAGADRAIELGEVADSVELIGNWIEGDWNDAGIHNPTGKVLTNLLIANNVVSNLQTGDHAIELVSACTGSLANNNLYADTTATILDPGSLKCNANYATDAIDQAGVAIPPTAAGTLGIGAIGPDTFVAGAIDATAIANGAIDAATFAAGAIDAAAIAAGAIDAATFAAGAIDATAIAAGAIDAATFAAGAIDAAAIADGAIDANTFAAGAIDATAIANGAIDRATFAADTGLQTLRSNTAAAGAAGTITLDVGASAVDDFYNNALVVLTGGTGVGQARLITDYTGATNVADVSPNWVTAPDNTSTFAVLAAGRVPVGSLGAGSIAAATFAAGAIDAAAIANGAIDAATFAAGAIDATAIANGAIDAATFAAGAIDAAAIANGAIDAATFAAGAIDAAAIATGAVDADAIAADTILGADNNNNAFASTNVVSNVDGSLIERLEHLAQVNTGGAAAVTSNPRLGVKVNKAAGDYLDSVQNAMFTVSGGRIMLTQLSGEISVAAVDVGASNTKFIANPTVGSDVDLCSVLDINGDAVGTLYSITGKLTDALTGGASGVAETMDRPIIIAEGTIDIKTSADSGTGGALFASELWYIPLDAGATVA